jgi:hypothetical protein
MSTCGCCCSSRICGELGCSSDRSFRYMRWMLNTGVAGVLVAQLVQQGGGAPGARAGRAHQHQGQRLVGRQGLGVGGNGAHRQVLGTADVAGGVLGRLADVQHHGLLVVHQAHRLADPHAAAAAAQLRPGQRQARAQGQQDQPPVLRKKFHPWAPNRKSADFRFGAKCPLPRQGCGRVGAFLESRAFFTPADHVQARSAAPR